MLARLTLILGLALAGGAEALAADKVEGDWFLPGGNSKVTISPCRTSPAKVCGAISWFKRPESADIRDVHNPDPALRERRYLGMPILWDFKSAGPDRWTGGKIYDPRSGKTYNSKLTVTGSGALKVEGCILMICQAQTWTR